MKQSLVDTNTIFDNATHVKAAANRKNAKMILAVWKSARFYDQQLRAKINVDREAHCKEPMDEGKELYKKSSETIKKFPN